MALTVTYGDRQRLGSQFAIPFTATFDSSYLTGGETLTAALFGLDRFENIVAEDSEGYTYDLDVATGGATATLKAYQSSSISPESIKLTDDDTAASNGVALYLHTKDGVHGWLEFVSPTNADGTGLLASGGSSFTVFDSDAAATDGVAVYYDQDATNTDERLMAVTQFNQNIYVPVGGNQFIKIKDNDTAASDGVQVYFDENGTNAYDRLLFVSGSNTDGTATTDDEYRPLAPISALVEVTSGTDLSAITINGIAYGR